MQTHSHRHTHVARFVYMIVYNLLVHNQPGREETGNLNLLLALGMYFRHGLTRPIQSTELPDPRTIIKFPELSSLITGPLGHIAKCSSTNLIMNEDGFELMG